MLKNLLNLPILCYNNVTSSAGLFGNVMCNKTWNISNQIFKSNSQISGFHKFQGKRESMVKRKMEMERSPVKKFIFGQNIMDMFPDLNLPHRLFQKVPFNDLPIVHIKVSKNNTTYTLTGSLGIPKLVRSCGVEGYKNAKKGTNMAAQLTGHNFARRAVDLGFKIVRVKIQGIGPGRSGSIKGLTSGGLEIISFTDCTPVSDVYPRPKKLRRL